MKENRIFLLLLLIISNIIYGQSSPNSEPIEIEKSTEERLDFLKIHDSVDEKAKLKTAYSDGIFSLELKELESTHAIILHGTIEKDGTITGLKFQDIKPENLRNIVKEFIREINQERIFEAGILNQEIVRSKIQLKLILEPAKNYVELAIL